VIPVTHETPGWTSKNFWVVGTVILPDSQVRVILAEYDSSAYTLPGMQSEPSAPDTDLPDPFTVGHATGLTVTERYQHVGGGVVTPELVLEWSDPDDAFLKSYDIRARRHPGKFLNGLTFNTGGYIDASTTDKWTIEGYRPGDKILLKGYAESTHDGEYKINSLDPANRRANVTPAPGSNSGPTNYWVACANPMRVYGRARPGEETFVISPIEIKDASEDWRVELVAENVLGIQSIAAENLCAYSDDFSQWGVGGTPTITATQADPDGGTNARLIYDDSSGIAERVSWGSGISGVDWNYRIGRKRFGGYLKFYDSTYTTVQVLNNLSPNIDYTLQLTWSGAYGSATVSISETENGLTGELVEIREVASNWFWLEFVVNSISPASEVWLSLYPASDTVARTGRTLFYRWHISDIDRRIVTPEVTSGDPTSEATVDNSVTDISSADSPYTVLESDGAVMVNLDDSMTINLPKAAHYPRRQLAIKVYANASDVATLTITAASGDTSEVTSLGSGDTSIHQRILVSDPGNNYWRVIAT
jgi:hypothetical protein